MKKIFLLIVLFSLISCKAQTIYPLRTYGIEFPKDSYVKDTNNELPSYVGTWKGTWNNKTIYITLKKVKFYLNHKMNKEYYKDILIGKFKVIDNNGKVLFDNTSVTDDKAKIEGSNFKKKDGKYSLIYIDSDLCGISGRIEISFTDSTKTKLLWEYSKNTNWIDTDCYYYGKPASERPDPLPYKIVLTK